MGDLKTAKVIDNNTNSKWDPPGEERWMLSHAFGLGFARTCTPMKTIFSIDPAPPTMNDGFADLFIFRKFQENPHFQFYSKWVNEKQASPPFGNLEKDLSLILRPKEGTQGPWFLGLAHRAANFNSFKNSFLTWNLPDADGVSLMERWSRESVGHMSLRNLLYSLSLICETNTPVGWKCISPHS